MSKSNIKHNFDNAWVLIGEKKLSDSRALQQIDWVKFSDLTFHIARANNNSDDLAIGYMFYGNLRDMKYEAIYDPETLNIAIKDIFDLRIKTPIELFMTLELRGLIVFDR